MGLFKSTSSARSRPRPVPRPDIRSRISRPIPLSDEEFPMRSHGLSVAQDGGPGQLDPETQRDSTVTSTYMALNAARAGQNSSLAPSGSNQSSNPSTPVRRRTNVSAPLRYSSASEATGIASLSRKKSTFRVVIGRLFGKRNTKQGSPSTIRSGAQVDPPHDYRSVSFQR